MHDIVFLSIPYANISTPPLGISVLSGVVKDHGFKSRCIDLSMELHRACKATNRDFENTQLMLLNPQSTTVDTFIEEFFDYWIKQILSLKPRYIGLSVFSFFTHFTAFYLCNRIRYHDPHAKIVLGGPGTNTEVSSKLYNICQMTSLQQLQKFGEFLRKKNLVDYVIVGDGEQAVIDLLSENSKLDQDQYQFADYKQEFAFADFDDYNLYDYQGQLGLGYPQLPIFTSKGCVRSCDFCDVEAIQQKFRFRQGENVIREMIYLAERYGIRDFNFADSLVNGSLKSLEQWVSELAKFNKQNPDKRITWSGSWICRPIGQTKLEFYQLLADSGCQALTIGTESGSNNVLAAMNKKTTVEALHFEAEQFYKHGIKFITLVIIGHWSEYWEDFIASIDMLYRLSQYVRTGNYVAIGIGSTLNILKNTPLEQDTSKNKIEYYNSSIWWTALNPGLTAKERYYRLLIAEKFCSTLNLPLLERVLPFTHNELQNGIEVIDPYYQSKVKNIVPRPQQHAEYFYNNFDKFLQQVQSRHIDSVLTLQMDVQAHVTNAAPGIEVYVNQTLVTQQVLSEGMNTLEINDIPAVTGVNLVAVRFVNKSPEDTIVDENGNIVKDKFLELKRLVINNIDLVQDAEFFMSHLQYQEQGQLVTPKFGFWFNHSELIVKFENPFLYWYNQHSRKNSKLAVDIITTITTSSDTDDAYLRDRIVEILRSLEY